MSEEMLQKYHQFQCQVCMLMVTTNISASIEDKIAKLIEHQNMRHLLDFTNSGLTDLERCAYYTGNMIYIDGQPEEIETT